MNSPPSDRTGWDALVIGAGPAGALMAELLARRRHAVLLVDKAVRGRPKVCGGCLGSIGLAALQEAGLPLSELGVDSNPLHRVAIHSRRRHVALPLARREAISRQAFDERLLAAAERAGVCVLTDCTARIESAEPGWRTVRLSHRDEGSSLARARLVIVAGGLGAASLLPIEERPATISEPASRLGAGAVLPPGDWCSEDGAVTMACGHGSTGYVGLAKLPDGSLDVAAALDPAALPEGANRLARLAARVLDHNGLDLPSGWFDAAWRSTPSLTQRPVTLGAERVLLIGDAAGYVEPFTGEGIGWALRSALAAEPIASEAIRDWSDGTIARWNHRHATSIGRWQKRCRLVCRLIGGRRATTTVVTALSLAPWIARPVLRLIDPPTQHAA